MSSSNLETQLHHLTRADHHPPGIDQWVQAINSLRATFPRGLSARPHPSEPRASLLCRDVTATVFFVGAGTLQKVDPDLTLGRGRQCSNLLEDGSLPSPCPQGTHMDQPQPLQPAGHTLGAPLLDPSLQSWHCGMPPFPVFTLSKSQESRDTEQILGPSSSPPPGLVAGGQQGLPSKCLS